jgi:UDP-N-acetylmuramyl pentapeptide synthase
VIQLIPPANSQTKIEGLQMYKMPMCRNVNLLIMKSLGIVLIALTWVSNAQVKLSESCNKFGDTVDGKLQECGVTAKELSAANLAMWKSGNVDKYCSLVTPCRSILHDLNSEAKKHCTAESDKAAILLTEKFDFSAESDCLKEDDGSYCLSQYFVQDQNTTCTECYRKQLLGYKDLLATLHSHNITTVGDENIELWVTKCNKDLESKETSTKTSQSAVATSTMSSGSQRNYTNYAALWVSLLFGMFVSTS